MSDTMLSPSTEENLNYFQTFNEAELAQKYKKESVYLNTSNCE
jgi:hypothetical protein